MDTHSTLSGESASDTASIASPTSKAEFSVVSYPLTPSEIEWLKAQSRRVGEASIRYFEERDRARVLIATSRDTPP